MNAIETMALRTDGVYDDSLEGTEERLKKLESRVAQLEKQRKPDSEGAPVRGAAAGGQDRTFAFNVGPDGKWKFDPPEDWTYTRKDLIRFETTTGPFEISLIPVAEYKTPISPFREPIVSGPVETRPDPNDANKSENVWSATTSVQDDGLSDAGREAVILSNRAPGRPGFVAKYTYRIQVTRETDSVLLVNDMHNGTFGC